MEKPLIVGRTSNPLDFASDSIDPKSPFCRLWYPSTIRLFCLSYSLESKTFGIAERRYATRSCISR
jgi:hypothetical protein